VKAKGVGHRLPAVTDRRYLDDSTVRQFTATVQRSDENRVVLDRTHFYPTGGGQPHDTGTLSAEGRTWRVTDVTGREDVVHHLDDPAPPPGTTVTGEIDWPRRRAHARYHTAQHLLSAHLLDAYGAETVGNQLYEDRARLDARHERFTETDLADVEAALNELVDADLPVRWYDLARETAEATLDASRTRLDLLPASVTEVRIVEIGDEERPYDRTACAGTHVGATGELGRVGVTGRETGGSGRERIRFELRR
jgi:misacylated tRNA(Ala) deacylase